MKPSRARLKQRANAKRWLQLGDELEKRARMFSNNHANTADARAARHHLFIAALEFAAAVDGEGS